MKFLFYIFRKLNFFSYTWKRFVFYSSFLFLSGRTSIYVAYSGQMDSPHSYQEFLLDIEKLYFRFKMGEWWLLLIVVRSSGLFLYKHMGLKKIKCVLLAKTLLHHVAKVLYRFLFSASMFISLKQNNILCWKVWYLKILKSYLFEECYFGEKANFRACRVWLGFYTCQDWVLNAWMLFSHWYLISIHFFLSFPGFRKLHLLLCRMLCSYLRIGNLWPPQW